MTAADITQWRVAVAGGGSMGAGIAQIAAACGHETTVLEINTEAAAAAEKRVQAGLTAAVKRGQLSAQEAAAAAARLRCSDDIHQLAAADIVIEAVAEDEAIKTDLFSRLEAVCSAQTLIATNTSSLPLSVLSARMAQRQRFAGMHFFNPAPRMRLVEIINTPHSSDSAITALFALARHWHKTPVLAQDAPGFIVNRLARPFYSEALRLLEEGRATVEQIDAALRAAGFRMGAFELMDLIGNDINYAVTESVWQRMGEDERFTPSPLQRQKRDSGLLGKKSGGGFYAYDAAGKIQKQPLTPPPVDPAAALPAVTLRGGHAGLHYLAQRAAAAGITVAQQAGDTAALDIGSCRLLPAESGGEDTENTVWIDYIADYAAAELFTLHGGVAAAEINAFFAAINKPVLLMQNPPAMIALRTIAAMVNLAAAAAAENLASRADMNTAMRCGVNHPHGPFEWVEVIGADGITRALRQLHQYYGGSRYQPAAPLAQERHG